MAGRDPRPPRVQGRLSPPPPHPDRRKDPDRQGEDPGRGFLPLAGTVKAPRRAASGRGELEAPPRFSSAHAPSSAFLYFREKKVDVAVIEVGMGGAVRRDERRDGRSSRYHEASPKDHEEHLGATISLIASRKRGSSSRSSPSSAARGPLLRRRVIGSGPRRWTLRFFDAFGRGAGRDGEKKGDRSVFRYEFEGEVFRLTPGLQGEHQEETQPLAAAAAEVLSRVWMPLEKKRSPRDPPGRWEGRWEPPREGRLSSSTEPTTRAARPPCGLSPGLFSAPPVLVFAMMKDKAIRRVISLLFPLADKNRPDVHSVFPGGAPEDILGLPGRSETKSWSSLLLGRHVSLARSAAGPADSVVVTGSLFLIAPIKSLPEAGERLKCRRSCRSGRSLLEGNSLSGFPPTLASLAATFPSSNIPTNSRC